jgi:predicted phosphodiesterase
VTTALVSDLHLGTGVGNDVARRPEVRERLAEALERADRVVFLGDLIELREQPLQQVLEVARPALSDLAAALAGKPVVLVAGNHDHRVVEPLLDGLRLDGRELGLEWTAEAGESPLGAEIARLLPESDVSLAYPGLRVRSDVYALHGHHLDMHMTVPRVESVIGSALARSMLGRDNGGPTTPDEYERALGPMYALAYAMAQGHAGKATRKHNTLSRTIWARASRDGAGGGAGGFLLGKVAIPAGVAALNAAGLGPFSATLTGEELRRAGLRAIGAAVDGLGVDSEHVIFGHTHRMGPLDGDDPGEWRTPAGVRLWNTGSWYREKVLTGSRPHESPYWPGGVVYVRDLGDPEPVNVLRDFSL